MRSPTTVSLLGLLLVASLVVSGHASYPCTSDADCQYEGCNDKDCSTAVGTHENIERCNGGRWDAECRCVPSCICQTWGPHGYLTTCLPKRDCPDGYLFSHEGVTAHFASLPDAASYDLTGIATSAECGERCSLLPNCDAFAFSASLDRCNLRIAGYYRRTAQASSFISCERIPTTTPSPTPMPGRWYHCANTDQVCTCYGRVRYGADGAFSEPQQVAGQISCSKTIFGDPIVDVVKTCECDPSEQSAYEHYPRACVTEANIQLHQGKTVAECANLCDARGMECKGFEFGVAHGVTFPAEKLCTQSSECDYSGCSDKPCTSQDWRCPSFPVHTFGCVYWALAKGGGGTKCMYGGWVDYPDWNTCPYPGSDFQPGDCRLKSSANTEDCDGTAFNGDFYAKVSSVSTSGTITSSSTTTASTTSSSTTTTPAPTTSSSTTTTPPPTTSNSSSTPEATLACVGDASAFFIADKVLCVPERFYPSANVENCEMHKTWRELTLSGELYATGGLGKFMIPWQWEVWLCQTGVVCGAVVHHEDVCFTYSEENFVFVPWGLRRELDL